MITAAIVKVVFSRDAYHIAKARLLEEAAEVDSPAKVGDVVSVLGELGAPNSGDTYELRGAWAEGRYGVEYKAKSAVKVIPVDTAGLFAWMARTPGVGRYGATQLAAKFGTTDALLAALEADDASALEPAVSKAGAESLLRDWRETNGRSRSLRWLAEKLTALDEKDRVALFETYETDTAEVVTRDPWRAVAAVLDFDKADAVSRNLGVYDRADARRINAAATLSLVNEAREGHVVARRLSKPVGGYTLERLTASTELAGSEIRRVAGGLALASLASAEFEAAELLRARVAASTFPELPPSVVPGTLSGEQFAAVELAARAGTAAIVGGAGTGKSTTMRAVTAMLRAAEIRNILLCAPTGKAARRLTETTGLPAMTIHSALKIQPGESIDLDPYAAQLRAGGGDDTPLAEADAVVIDEVSMLDSVLFALALRTIKPTARLVLVGDPGQLPSVGPGAVLRDVLGSGVVPTARLTRIYRTAAESAIPHVAAAIREGDDPRALLSAKSRDVAFVQCPTASIPSVVCRLFSASLQTPSTRRAFAPGEIQVISPRKGEALGTEALNRALQGVLNPVADSSYWISGARLREGDRVVHTRNNPSLGVVNGEIGTVLQTWPEPRAIREVDPKNPARERVRKVVARVDFDGVEVHYTRGQLRELQHAWALTVHKMQGSAAPCIVFVCDPSHGHMLTSTLVYTALTRAEEYVVVVGDLDAFAASSQRRDTLDRATLLGVALRA